MKPLATGLVLGLFTFAGCDDVIDLDPLDERPVVEAQVRPRSIIGGTLTITADGVAVAADPDRDVVHVVDLDQRSVRSTIGLKPGDEPGRVVEGRAGVAHVVLRGGSGIATLDLNAGAVVSRRKVCPDPRGVAFDAAASSLHVSCADGTLVTLDEASGDELDRRRLEPDLRDVVLVGGEVLVSRFRAADLVGLDGGRLGPDDDDAFASTVAWRTRVDSEGRVVMLHQLSDKSAISIKPSADEVKQNDLPYGGGGFCEPGLSDPAITITDASGETFTKRIKGVPLTVDAAVSPDGELIALAMPGAAEDEPSLGFVTAVEGDECFIPHAARVPEQFTAVAFDPDGRLVAQSREPAMLVVFDSGIGGAGSGIDLPGESRYDTGHEIFHRQTDSGLSCATCHPEGTDDGHVWVFEGLGPRRTQALDVGLEGTAPFHWDGDMGDLDVLMGEVLAHRMGGSRQSKARRDSFARWLFAQERPPADAGLDETMLVAEGEALFASLDCDRCHSGAKLGGGLTTPIGDDAFQVPVLRRVSLRPPFMHDGRSATLEDAVSDMIDKTTAAQASAHDVEALTAYMRTL